MAEETVPGTEGINSFSCRCILKNGVIYPAGPSPQLYRFFGTTASSYSAGMLTRIRRDIGEKSASAVGKVVRDKVQKGEDFRLVYPTKRADGSACMLQMDGYAGGMEGDCPVYEIIGMDITDLVEAKKETGRLSAENRTLLEDSPVGLGIYHIRDNAFDLVYTNAEYYRVHHGSREYWDRYKGGDALNRILPEDRAVLLDEWKRTLGDPAGHIYNASYRCLGEDGQLHWIRLLARLAEEQPDGVRVCYASYLNIDNEKKAEETAEHLSRSMIDTINRLPTISVLFRIEDNGVFIP